MIGEEQVLNGNTNSSKIAPNLFGPVLTTIKQHIHTLEQQQQQQQHDINATTSTPASTLSVETCWNFVQQLIDIIDQNHAATKNASHTTTTSGQIEEELISTQTLSDYKTGLELIVVWGIVPRLCKGIGIDMKKRIDMDTKALVQHLQYHDTNIAEHEKLSFENCSRVLSCVHALLTISRNDLLLQQIVYDYYFADVIASYIQLIYMKKPKNVVEQTVVECVDVTKLNEFSSPAHLFQFSSSSSTAASHQTIIKRYGFSERETERCANEFNHLMKSTHETVIANSLLLLVSESGSSSAKWFTHMCSSFLSILLTRPKGVFAVTHSLLEDIPESHLQKYERVVQLVLKKPQQCATLDMYYGYICPQILRMLRLRGQKFAHISRAAQLYAGTIVQQQPDLAQKYILGPIIKPLNDFIKFGSIVPENHEKSNELRDDESTIDEEEEEERDVLISETELGQCIEDLHHLLHGNAPTPTLFDCITMVVPAIFQLYCFVSRTKLNLKTACEEIISSYFKISDRALDVIKSLLIFERNKFATYCIFAGGSTGGVCIKRVKQTSRDYMWEARCMIQLLKLMKNDSVAGDLFVHLMTQFTLLEQRTEEVNHDLIQTLGPMNESYMPEENVIILQMLQLIMEELGPSIMKNTLQTIAFIKFLLLKHESNRSENDFEMITMGLGILSTIICGAIPVRTAEEEHALNDIQPILRRLVESHPNEQVSEMSATANLGIETKQYREHFDGATAEVSEEEKTEIRLRTILNDLKDPLLPVRAHGVMSLRSLVLEKGNPTVRKHMKNILRIFQTQLKDSDSYVYIGAIRGLSAMADMFPDEIIPIITESFEDKKMPCTERVKLGEAMVEIIERCGELLPKYAQQFIFSLLKCCREMPSHKSKRSKVETLSKSDSDGSEIIPSVNDDSSIIRASSLSNLSDVVDVLKYGMHPYVSDILTNAATLLETDTSYHVRRAAVHIFSRLVNSLDVGLFNLFFTNEELNKVHFGMYEGTNPVTEVIRVLKYAETYDTDNLIRVNAKTVLVEIEDIIYEILRPKETLEGAHNLVKFR